MKIIQPPQSSTEDTGRRKHPTGIPVEGELVRRRGEIFRIAVNSEEIRELSYLT
jgi:hypothetical protein